MAASDLRKRLANSTNFLGRIEVMLAEEAKAIKAESTGTVNHAARAAYADQVLLNAATHALRWSPYIVGATNVAGTITANDDGTVSSSVIDAALLSQIATDWNVFAVSG